MVCRTSLIYDTSFELFFFSSKFLFYLILFLNNFYDLNLASEAVIPTNLQLLGCKFCKTRGDSRRESSLTQALNTLRKIFLNLVKMCTTATTHVLSQSKVI